MANARLAAARIVAPVLVTAEEVTTGKPDPACFVHAADLLGVRADRCLVVEDSEPGLQAARRAGAMVAALKGLPGDVLLPDLHHLALLLRSGRRPEGG